MFLFVTVLKPVVLSSCHKKILLEHASNRCLKGNHLTLTQTPKVFMDKLAAI